MREIKKIIVHCSDSDFGNAALIDSWHKERGWRGIGYHFVILNGVPAHGKLFNPAFDGCQEMGRPVAEIGAHCKGHNADSIGICLIGRHHFTARQLYSSLPHLLGMLMAAYKLQVSDIYGHRDFSSKTCPNIDTGLIREAVQRFLK